MHDDRRRPIAVGQLSNSGDLEIVHALSSFFQLNLLDHSSLIVTTFCKDRDPTCKLTMDVETIKLFFPIAFRCFQF